MVLVLIIVGAALGSALFFVGMSKRHANAISRFEELDGRTKPVDMKAFRNLIALSEARYLEENLPAKVLRSIQRERALAAAEYVQRIAHNARVLSRLGQAARTNPDPEVARAATAMVNSALAVRLLAMRALAKLYVQAWLPQIGFSAEDVFDRYRRLTDSASLFVRLQQPAYASRLSAML